eukprot:gene24684-33156_t
MDEKGLQKIESIVRCDYYIKRKKRFCSNRATGFSSKIDDSGENIIVRRCSMHTEAALQDARAMDIYMRTLNTCRQILNDILAEIESTTGCKDALPTDSAVEEGIPFAVNSTFLSIDLTPTLQEADLDWRTIFSNPQLPLHIDVGCARGNCLERLSKRPERRSWNHLGIEIRSTVIAQAIAQLDSRTAEHRNLHFLACNFAASAEQILSSLPPGCLQLFPDPWRRSKHKKRLIVQPGLVALLRKHMPAGAAVYLSSDCKLIAESMREQFLSPIDMAGSVSVDEDDEEDDSNVARPDDARAVTVTSSGGQFRLVREADLSQQVSHRHSVVVDGDDSRENPLLLLMDENAFLCKSTLMQTSAQDGSGDGWISFNPLSEPSEREQVCEVSWRPVYRSVLVKATVISAGPEEKASRPDGLS